MRPEDLPPPTQGAEAIRDAADAILARPEFQPPARTLVQRLQDLISEQLARFFNLFADDAGFIAWIIAVAVLAALTYVIYRLARTMGVGRVRGGDPLAVDVERRRPPAEWLSAAAAAEARGDWREGLRCRYRALVARLAAVGVVDEVPGTTAGEYRAAVAVARPPVERDFTTATALFEAAWYGRQPTGPEEGASFRSLSDRVLVGAERAP